MLCGQAGVLTWEMAFLITLRKCLFLECERATAAGALRVKQGCSVQSRPAAAGA